MRGDIGLVAGDRVERRDHVLEALGRAALGHSPAQAGLALFQEVAVARQPPHLSAARQAQRLPAEYRPIERPRAIGVARLQAIEVQRAGLVDDLRAPVLFGLPDAELRPLPIAEHRHSPRLHDVEGLGEDAAAGLPRLRGGIVGALDPNVRLPDGLGSPVGRRRDRRHVASAEARDEVLARRAGRHDVLEIPSEETAVEGDGGLWIGLTGVDPAGDPGGVSVSLGHWRSFLGV